MKKLIPLVLSVVIFHFFVQNRLVAQVTPHIGNTVIVYNGNNITGGAAVTVNMFIGQSVTVRVNGSNGGTATAPQGGITLQIREVNTANNNQINLTSVSSTGAVAGKNTWWKGDLLGNNVTVSQYLHIESTWTSWTGGGVYKTLNATFTALQAGTYHLYTKMYLTDGAGNWPRDPSGSSQYTDHLNEATYLIGTLNVQVPAPTATAATSVGQNSFTANWRAVTGANAYHLDVSTSSSFSSRLSGYNDANMYTSTSCNVVGLGSGSTYYYRVRAYSGSTASSNSNTITVLTIPGNPTVNPPTGISSSGFTANWNQMNGATGYYLDVSTNSSFTSYVSGYQNLSCTSNTQQVTGLSVNTYYYYRVRSRNSSGTSGNSDIMTAITLGNPPAAPFASTATGITTTGFTANWTDVTGASGYRLDVSNNNSFSSFITGYNDLDVGKVNSRAVSGLSPNTQYYFRVRAYNANGSSANSNIFTVSTLVQFTIVSITLNATPLTINFGDLTTSSGSISGTGNGTTTVYYEYQKPNTTTWLSYITSDVTLANGAANLYSIPYTPPFDVTGIWKLRCRTVAPTAITSNEVSVTVNAPLKPDLTVTQVSLNKTTVQNGGTLNVTYTLKNQGPAASTGTSFTGIYLGTSQYNAQTFLLENPSASLTSVGATRSETAGVIIPSGTLPGNYYIVVYADYKNQVDEGTNEGNNINGTAVQIIKFQVTTVTASLTPSILNSGDIITRSGTVTGTGDGQITYHWEWKNPGGTVWNNGFDKTTTMTSGQASVTAEQVTGSLVGTSVYRLAISAPNSVYSSEASVLVVSPRKLTVPYYSQGSYGWCGPAALAMVLKYYGISKTIKGIAADNNMSSADGLTDPQIRDYLLNNIGVSFYYERSLIRVGGLPNWPNIALLRNFIKEKISAGKPVLMGSDEISHWFVITGFDDSNVYLNDPSGYCLQATGKINAPTGFYQSELANIKFTWNEFENNLMGGSWGFPLISSLFFGIVVIDDESLLVSNSVSTIEIPEGFTYKYYYRGDNTYSFPHFTLKNKEMSKERKLYFTWDGAEPYSGYRYMSSATDFYSPDLDNVNDNIGLNATILDSIQLSVIVANPGQNIFNGRVEANLINLQTSQSFVISNTNIKISPNSTNVYVPVCGKATSTILDNPCYTMSNQEINISDGIDNDKDGLVDENLVPANYSLFDKQPGRYKLELKLINANTNLVESSETACLNIDFKQKADIDKPLVIKNTPVKWYNASPLLDIDFSDNISLNSFYYQVDSNNDTDPSAWHLLTSDGISTLTGSQNNQGTALTADWKISNTDWNSLSVNVQNGGKHYLYFKVSDDAGNIYITPDQASSFEIRKDVSAPNISFNAPLEGQTVTSSTIVASWSADDLVAGLLLSDLNAIYISVDQSSSFTKLAGSARNYTFNSLQNGSHAIYLKAEDNAGNISAVKQVTFTINNGVPTGVESPGLSKVRIYPNPVSGILNIEYSSEDFRSINILNYSGALVVVEKVIYPHQKLDFEKYEHGMYILEFVKYSGDKERVKIIKR